MRCYHQAQVRNKDLHKDRKSLQESLELLHTGRDCSHHRGQYRLLQQSIGLSSVDCSRNRYRDNIAQLGCEENDEGGIALVRSTPDKGSKCSYNPFAKWQVSMRQKGQQAFDQLVVLWRNRGTKSIIKYNRTRCRALT